MTQIIKGENLPIPGQAWRIEVVHEAVGDGVPEVTSSALFLDATGKALGRLALEQDGGVGDRPAHGLDLDTERIGPEVQRVVIVAVVQDGGLGQVPGLSVRTLSAATGERLALYEIDGATIETALVLGEYYRRDGGWKFRAVGEGYEAGLKALEEDFGLSRPTPELSGPVPLELPRGAVGKASAPAGALPVALPGGAVGKSTGTAAGTQWGRGPSSAQGQEQGEGRGGGRGLTKGEAEGNVPGPHAPPTFTPDRSEPRPGDPSQGRRPREASSPTPSRGPRAMTVLPSPTPSPEAVDAAGTLGGEFDDIVYSGRGSAKFSMDATPPPGYVLVDFARTGKGSFQLDSIDWNGREAVDLGNSATSDRFERRVMWCDNLYPLRFRVECGERDEWTIVIRPVSGARLLGAAATGWGSEVLIHTGPAGELVSRLRSPDENASLRVMGHKPRRPGAPAPYPDVLASDYGRRRKDAQELSEGPLLVAVVQGMGDWSLEIRPSRSVPQQEKRSGFWRRIIGS
ncbi:TerD family protein [Streptomyces sp. NPDC047971]|uniref:TerD family protein n=1 Tax=Streptomyces sp. NPDC047971 TaxID=3154499 RepID=UPI0033E72623